MTSTAPGPDHPPFTEFAECARRGAELLRAFGARRTPGRAAMVAVLLQASPRHLSIAEIEQRMHAAGWQADNSGLHRAMATFIDRGRVHTLPAPGPVAYGLSNPGHHHAICSSCGAVTEIPLTDLAAATGLDEDAVLPRRQPSATLEEVAQHRRPAPMSPSGRGLSSRPRQRCCGSLVCRCRRLVDIGRAVERRLCGSGKRAIVRQ